MTIDRLHVLWSDAVEHRRQVIGELSRANGLFTFAYTDAGTTDALPEFRGATSRSAARLFATFSERIPSKRRQDRELILSELGLVDPADDFEVLALSGGMLVTDRVELAEVRDIGDTFERPLKFRVAGARRYPEFPELVAGETFTVDVEPDNEFDPNACRLLRASGCCAGYIPLSYTPAVKAFVQTGGKLSVCLLRSAMLPHQPRPQWIAELKAI